LASPSRTFASDTWTRSSRAASSARTSPRCCGSSAKPGEAERRLRERLSRLRSAPLLGGAKLSGELERLQRQLEQLQAEPTDEEIWRSVELARHPDRPYTLDYVERILADWVELHGDRGRADDGAMVTGLGSFDGRTVVLVGQQKGRDIQERTKRQFGMPYPEGYRKAMRAMELADRHGLPLISLVDTPGAYPGVAAEQHGQGGTIAQSQALMARLQVPIVACVIGEGGSGGAIAIALADRVLMQENAIYSVISPEGCAAILWRDAGEARKAAAAFKPDAGHCLELGVIDGIVPEPEGGAQNDWDQAARLLKETLRDALDELEGVSGADLVRRRRAKFREMGVFA
jgi:acetyl-CoA carboxylase carboxyl transferase subunit alpha